MSSTAPLKPPARHPQFSFTDGTIAVLAENLKPPPLEESLILASSYLLQSSENYYDWLRLFDLRQTLFHKYFVVENDAGKEYEHCGNVCYSSLVAEMAPNSFT